MNENALLLPVLLMVLLTFVTGFWLLKQRFQAVQQHTVSPSYFLLKRGKVPEPLAKVDQHYVNLFELPVLFYLLVVLLYLTETVNPLQLGLAWAFVASRGVHSYVHMTHNRLTARMYAFLLGALILGIAWVEFAWQILRAM